MPARLARRPGRAVSQRHGHRFAHSNRPDVDDDLSDQQVVPRETGFGKHLVEQHPLTSLPGRTHRDAASWERLAEVASGAASSRDRAVGDQRNRARMGSTRGQRQNLARYLARPVAKGQPAAARAAQRIGRGTKAADHDHSARRPLPSLFRCSPDRIRTGATALRGRGPAWSPRHADQQFQPPHEIASRNFGASSGPSVKRRHPDLPAVRIEGAFRDGERCPAAKSSPSVERRSGGSEGPPAGRAEGPGRRRDSDGASSAGASPLRHRQ
ncbi:hypothetical protein FsymDg_3714 [Candidatus Protofrankia datiscae]|uniref:Uncharacterized protein n=1 Tax=Candidatus Protofrankia datiscae TaxID=2716812 RepID=F8B478_9ACTN|nr:hypothetical protein FsymDg_3714 [Candidatus Protofrankia datiscae]